MEPTITLDDLIRLARESAADYDNFVLRLPMNDGVNVKPRHRYRVEPEITELAQKSSKKFVVRREYGSGILEPPKMKDVKAMSLNLPSDRLPMIDVKYSQRIVPSREEMRNMNVGNLRTIANTLNISLPASMGKSALIEAIVQASSSIIEES